MLRTRLVNSFLTTALNVDRISFFGRRWFILLFSSCSMIVLCLTKKSETAAGNRSLHRHQGPLLLVCQDKRLLKGTVIYRESATASDDARRLREKKRRFQSVHLFLHDGWHLTCESMFLIMSIPLY